MEWTQFSIDNPELLKKQFLIWASNFSVLTLLDSNGILSAPASEYDWILAVDSLEEIQKYEQEEPFQAWQNFITEKKNTWLFGWIHYDLKNCIEDLNSIHSSTIPQTPLYFYIPRYVILCKGNIVKINRNYPEAAWIFSQIQGIEIPKPSQAFNFEIHKELPRNLYLEQVREIQRKIKEGIVYEVNLCREIAGRVSLKNLHLHYLELTDKAKSPFSVYFKRDKYHVLCFSPERFLKKKDQKVISQPIKGTRKVAADYEQNQNLISELQSNEKEKAEHVMIVDLVRNDLSKSCVPGSIQVEEFCKVYSFPYVHQMISSIHGMLKPSIQISDVFKNAFPMGSMTGAPKIEVMKVIEELETSKRGLFSGSIGYIDPEQNFDFNVVIRTLEYEENSETFSIQSGGAITIDSEPEAEWDEIQLKSSFILQYLKS